MALVHILDKQTDEITGTLDVGEYTDAVRRSSLDNKNQFDFIALKHFDKLEKRNRLLVQDADGFFHEYIITFAEQRDRYQKHIMSDASFVDLAKAKIIPPTTLQGATPYTAAEYALADTEWQVGEVEYTDTRTITIGEYTNPYDLLKQIASEFGLEIRFRVKVSGNRIVGRYVDLKQQIAGFEGKEIEFGKDLIGITRKEDNSQIVTALLGVGPKREDGTRLTYLAVDTDALQRWGRNGKHLIDVYEPESADVNMALEQLRELTEAELKKRIDAIVTYEGTAAAIEHIPGLSHEKIRLGQTVRIKDTGYTPPLYVEARIQEVEEDPATRRVLSFKLGNFIEYKKEDLEKQIKLLKELMKQKASSADVQQALEYAEQKAQEAETNAKQYADVQDAFVREYAESQAQQAEQNAKNYADQTAEQKANQVKSELETTIAAKADADWVNGQLQTKADKADTYTKTEVDNALNGKVSVTQYTTDMDGIVTRLDSAESRITQNEQEIATKVSNTQYQQDKTAIEGDISSLETRMTNAETSITQNANQIALKANQTEVDSLTGRVSNAESSINLLADEMELKVNKDGVIAAINLSSEQARILAEKIMLDGYVEAKHIKSLNGLNVNNQFVVDSNGNVSISNNKVVLDTQGVTVKQADFLVEDPITSVKTSIVKKTNLVQDHSFEMFDADANDNPVDISRYPEDFWFKWKIYGSPKLLSDKYTEVNNSYHPIFGANTAVVNRSNSFEQYIPVKPNRTYTLSAFFRTSMKYNPSGAKPRLHIEFFDANDNSIGGASQDFPATPANNPVVVRYAKTFTTPSNARSVRILPMSVDYNTWIEVDGIQLVEGDRPVTYDPEDSLWQMRTGFREKFYAIHSPVFDTVAVKYLGLDDKTISQANGFLVLRSLNDRIYLQSPIEIRAVKPYTTADYIPILASAFLNQSQRESKKNIEPFNDSVVEKIKNTQVYTFHFNYEEDDAKKHLGLMVEEAPEHIVSGDSIDLYAMNSYLWRCIQELIQRIEKLEEMVATLATEA